MKQGLLPASGALIVRALCGAAVRPTRHRARDIKPENVLVDRKTASRSRLRLAKLLGEPAGTPDDTGQVMGTPLHGARAGRAPARRRSRADIYSLGVVFYGYSRASCRSGASLPSRRVGVDVRLDRSC
jgi:hypothetical protein